MASPNFIDDYDTPIPFEPVNQVHKVVAVDMDGFLTEETCWTEEEMLTATPKKKTVEWLREKFDGNFIIIYTARPEKYRNATKKWLVANDIPYNMIEMGKLVADEYWDDRAFNLEDIK